MIQLHRVPPVYFSLSLVLLALLTAPAARGQAYPAVDGEVGVVNKQFIWGDLRRYGVDLTGQSDSSTQVQNAIDSANNAGYARFVIHVPVGTIRIDKTLKITVMRGLVVQGESSRSATFRWHGPATHPVILLTGTQNCTFERFNVTFAGDALAGLVIRHHRGELPPTANTFRDIRVDGEGAKIQYGFYIAGPELSIPDLMEDNVDANNEFHRFHECVVIHYQDTAYFIGNCSQAKFIAFYNCSFNYDGKWGVRAVRGSFEWHGGGGGHNAVADFEIGFVGDTFLIEGGSFENSARLCVTGEFDVGAPVRIENCRFAANLLPKLNPDGDVVNLRHAGPFVLRNNTFYNAGQNEVMPKIVFHPHSRGSLIVEGNSFIFPHTAEVSPFDFTDHEDVAISVRNNTFYKDDISTVTAGVHVPDGDATPTTHCSDTLIVANSKPTTITGLDNGWPGRQVTLLFTDANTSVDFTGTALTGHGGKDWRNIRPGDSMICTFHAGQWYCIVSAGQGDG